MASSASTTSRMTLVLTPTGSDSTQPIINQKTTPAVERLNTAHSAPQMGDYHITKEKRQQLRGLLVESQPLTPNETARQDRSNSLALPDDERKMYYAELDEILRWNTFLLHSGLNIPEVVDFVSWGYNANEEEHQCALAQAVESHESFKTTTCSNLQKQATSLIKTIPNLRELDDLALTQQISDSFSLDKFFAAFAFMADFLNYGGSSPLGKWYAKGIYVNMTRTVVRLLCDPSGADQWSKILSTFEKMALLEVHDTVDMADFSELTSAYRSRKEKDKQEWAELESHFVNLHPAPAKEGPVADSDFKTTYGVVFNSAIGEAHGSEDDDAHNAHSESQQSSSSTLGCGHPLSVQEQLADKESDISSKNQKAHREGDAETAKDTDLEDSPYVVWDDGYFGDATITGLKHVTKVKKVKKIKKGEKVQVPDHGNSGSNIAGWIADLDNAEGVEEQVVAQVDGRFGCRSDCEGGFGCDLDAAMAELREKQKMPKLDDGGSTRRSVSKDDGLEKAKEVSKCADGGNVRRSTKIVALFTSQEAMVEEANAREAKLEAKVEETKAGIALAKKVARRGCERERARAQIDGGSFNQKNWNRRSFGITKAEMKAWH